MEKDNSGWAVQIIKLDNIIGNLSSSVTYSAQEVDFCISMFMQNRGKVNVKVEPQAMMVPVKKETEKDLSFTYECYNKYNRTEGSFIQESVKEEFSDEVNDKHKTGHRSLSDHEYEVASINENDNARNYVKGMEESAFAKTIKVEGESNSNEYKHNELDDTKHNIDIKENIIECPVDSTDDTSTSVYDDGNKHDSKNYFGIEATSVTDARNPLTGQEGGTILHERKHIKTVLKENKMYDSQECSESFTVSNNLNTPNSSINEVVKYQCDQCKKHFTQKWYILKHIQTVHSGIVKYECQKCKKTFATSGSLNTHLSSIHEGIKYKCDQCNKNFTQKWYILEHIQTVHSGIVKYECQKCKKTFTTSSSLNTHLSSIHEGIKYKCEQCKKRFKWLRHLQEHVKFVHMKTRKHECQKCKKTFPSSRNLNGHVRSIHGKIKYKCEQCEKSFTQPAKLQEHIKIVHMKIRKYECEKCKKTFTTSNSLKIHFSSIHEEIKYKCEQCRKSFTQPTNLQEHIKIVHNKIRKYECQKCKKTFATSNSLKIHLSSIHEEIKYKCEQCKKSFTQPAKLQEHIKIVHMKIRKYECQKCEKMFLTLYNLNRHLSSMHKR